jgi:replicative DNA helicase
MAGTGAGTARAIRVIGALMKHIREILDNVFDGLESAIEKSRSGDIHISGTATGFADLDYFTVGFQPSDLIVLGGATSSGKTSLALQMAYGAAIGQSRKVCLVTPEASGERVMQRLLSMETGVETHRLRSGEISENEWDRIARGFGRLSESQIYIDDSTTSVMDIRFNTLALRAENGLDLVIIDYLQLLSGPPSENRSAEISEITRQLKALARELRVPIVIVSQISDAIERRAYHMPLLTDLKDSGGIEEVADVILFIYREEMYEEDSERKGFAEIIVAKHRNGPVGSIHLRFFDRIARFTDLVIPVSDTKHVDHV